MVWQHAGVKHFVNARDAIVTEALDAEIMLSGGALRRLEGAPSIKVVLRADWDRAKVAVVSGGGAGHEPAHAGFVGDGMLTAAVSGEIFASPSVDAVLAAILAVTGDAGCLLLVKNYTGDRLNFGLAAEKARSLGRRVEMVVVGDDIALPDAPRPRGIAGTLFVHKVAGHCARAGAPLDEVKARAERVARAVVSMGVALSSCNVPGVPSENRIAEGHVELGLGIHGEPGATTAPLSSLDALVADMIEALEAKLDASPLALMINDLGGVPPIEMALVARAVLASTKRHEVRLVLGPERLMTSLDMKGFSISALPLDPATEEALVSPTGARAWPTPKRPRPMEPVSLPEALRPREHRPSSHDARRRMLARVCETLVGKQAELDTLDAKVGDGDTGTTLATAARAIADDLDRLPLAEPADLCGALSERLARVMGGSSGVLLAVFTAAMASRLRAGGDWPAALVEGTRRMMAYGGAKIGDRTMLDALSPAVDVLASGGDIHAAARAAKDGAAATATITKTASGRSSYVNEDALRGVPDPGAIAVAAVFEAVARDDAAV